MLQVQESSADCTALGSPFFHAHLPGLWGIIYKQHLLKPQDKGLLPVGELHLIARVPVTWTQLGYTFPDWVRYFTYIEQENLLTSVSCPGTKSLIRAELHKISRPPLQLAQFNYSAVLANLKAVWEAAQPLKSSSWRGRGRWRRKKKEPTLLLQGLRSWSAREGTTDSIKACSAFVSPTTHAALLMRIS